MGTHYLSKLFKPRSVAVIGASSKTDSVGGVTFRNILQGGYQGPVYPVNLKHMFVQGKKAYASIHDISKPVDLAVIATPANSIPDVIKACSNYGVSAAVIMSAGFREVGNKGRRLEEQVLSIARRGKIRFLGPNCLGIARPGIGLNATFSKSAAKQGNLALVSQSGALCTSVMDWAAANDVGFSSVVSTGISADIGIGEILDFLVSDPQTDGILLYVEGISDARRFVSGLRAAARAKPIIVMKSGRHDAGSRAAVSHTGALVGDDDVFEAALARAGVVRVINFSEFFAAAQVLSSGLRVDGERLAIVTNGGGPGVMAMDRLADHGLSGAELCAQTMATLDSILPPTWSHANPVDVIGDAPPERYRDAVSTCLKDPNVDAVLAILTPQAMTESKLVAKELTGLSQDLPKPLLTCWMGELEVESGRALFRTHNLPSYKTPESAVEAFHVLAAFQRNQQQLLQVPDPLTQEISPDVEGSRLIIDSVLAQGRQVLSEMESKALLAAFHIPITRAVHARDAREALVLAEEIGFPVVLKVNSPDISHKSDVGGVVLNIGDAPALLKAYKDLLHKLKQQCPEARLDGVIVEKMCLLPHGREFMVGIIRDPAFGPVITFGSGGTAVEVYADRSVALPPLNHYLVQRMIEGTRAAKLLGQFRHLPPANAQALENVLLRASEMVCELPQIQEMDINPLIVDENGAVAVDARIIVARRTPHQLRYAHMAIHPYPTDLVEQWQRPDGNDVSIRPIRSEDAVIEARFVRALSAQSRYFRFMHSLRELTPAMLSRFTQIDYDREMGLIAVTDRDDREVQIGVARYVVNPDGESCEFAIVVADEWQRQGVAARLMGSLIRAAQEKGLKLIEGEILSENHNMLEFLKHMGLEIRPDPEDPQLKRASKIL